MPLICEKTATSYGVEIDNDDFLRLTEAEGWSGWIKPDDQLDVKLRNRGCDQVEYNGHYGACIYFTLNVEDDSAKERRAIIKLIEDHIAGLGEKPTEEDEA